MTGELDALVERIVAQVRARVEAAGGTPLPAVTGTWQDESALRLGVAYGADRLGTAAHEPTGPLAADLAGLIDHTLLKPTATRRDIEGVCAEARRHRFYSVCLNSTWIPLAVRLLEGSGVRTVCVVGFPLGAASTEAKASETSSAVDAGAAEIDMVVNIGKLKGGEYDAVLEDIRSVVRAARSRPVKVILETSLLTREEKIAGSALAKAAGAAFVKTSTGFAGGGATVEDVGLIREVVGPEMGIKASGGVRTARDAARMVAAGADRIGASASVAIVTGGEPKDPT
ncbi:MAG: deoxyribose-phosphate aldolase [Deltaproteobacteria bacterium]|nr:deoxyribose-phosphate aldolase [Deltaproteobacteria bacterium]